jgi:hypothetical protein
VDGLHRVLFFDFFEIHNLKFQNILKKIWIVDNDESYVDIKNQYEIYCILGCVKMTNFQIWGVNSETFENHQISQNLSFLCRSEYKLFCFDILKNCELRHYKRLGFFLEFFENFKMLNFKKFKNRLHGARPPNRFFGTIHTLLESASSAW